MVFSDGAFPLRRKGRMGMVVEGYSLAIEAFDRG